jgi:hypothetical protein
MTPGASCQPVHLLAAQGTCLAGVRQQFSNLAKGTCWGSVLQQLSSRSGAGHLSGLALGGLRQVGRGFAAQQLIEEWNARRALSAKVGFRALAAGGPACREPRRTQRRQRSKGQSHGVAPSSALACTASTACRAPRAFITCGHARCQACMQLTARAWHALQRLAGRACGVSGLVFGLPQVVKAIQRGEHAAAPLGTSIWWAHRLLSGRRLLGRTQQRALIR